MSNFININESKISVIGLGYVGLPLAIEFSNKFEVVGFDIDKQRVQELKNGYDRTNEISEGRLNKLPRLELSSSISSIRESNIYIITVPTPVDKRNKPNLNPLISATKTVASVISKNDVVIYESTVFPGCTEQVCIPVIEQISKLKYNSDFFVGTALRGSTPEIKNMYSQIFKKLHQVLIHGHQSLLIYCIKKLF